MHRALFDLTAEAEMGHIELSRAADLVVVAPATADLIAKLAQGLANDLASTLLLATDKRVLLAPAMNVRMWQHPATRRNLAAVVADGALVVGPDEGEMACGEYGPGRMAEPPAIVAAVAAALAPGPLAGRHVLVTSGPTHEPIDPVRYIANRSSGRQGSAIAAALARRGARVTFVTGPAEAPRPPGATVVEVETAGAMLAAVEAALPADAAVFAAAVADWRVANAGGSKAKKDGSGRPPALDLVENPDILKTVAARGAGRPALVVGFAAETDDLVANATAKLARKGADWIVANDVSPAHRHHGRQRERGDADHGRRRRALAAHVEGCRRRGARRSHRPGAGMTAAVAVRRLAHRDPALPLPAYASAGAAGMDLCASLAPGDRALGLTLQPGARALVPSGLALEIPPGHEVQLRPRSGLALRQGLTLLNSPGTIDSDYRGEVGVILINHGAEPVTIAHGMRIAQMVLAPVARIAWREAETLEGSVRGAGGFGSTGTGAPAR